MFQTFWSTKYIFYLVIKAAMRLRMIWNNFSLCNIIQNVLYEFYIRTFVAVELEHIKTFFTPPVSSQNTSISFVSSASICFWPVPSSPLWQYFCCCRRKHLGPRRNRCVRPLRHRRRDACRHQRAFVPIFTRTSINIVASTTVLSLSNSSAPVVINANDSRSSPRFCLRWYCIPIHDTGQK